MNTIFSLFLFLPLFSHRLLMASCYDMQPDDQQQLSLVSVIHDVDSAPPKTATAAATAATITPAFVVISRDPKFMKKVWFKQEKKRKGSRKGERKEEKKEEKKDDKKDDKKDEKKDEKKDDKKDEKKDEKKDDKKDEKKKKEKKKKDKEDKEDEDAEGEETEDEETGDEEKKNKERKDQEKEELHPPDPSLIRRRSASEITRLKTKGSSRVAVLFRGDTRPPRLVFAAGFDAPGRSLDLDTHVEGSRSSGYVATSRSFQVAALAKAGGGGRFEGSAGSVLIYNGSSKKPETGQNSESGVKERRKRSQDDDKYYVYAIAPGGLEGYWLDDWDRLTGGTDSGLEFAVIGRIPRGNIRYAYEVSVGNGDESSVSSQMDVQAAISGSWLPSKPYMENKEYFDYEKLSLPCRRR